jgi:hypothetical protein
VNLLPISRNNPIMGGTNNRARMKGQQANPTTIKVADELPERYFPKRTRLRSSQPWNEPSTLSVISKRNAKNRYD